MLFVSCVKRMGYSCIRIDNFEDEIRKPVDHRKNILTGLFKNMNINIVKSNVRKETNN